MREGRSAPSAPGRPKSPRRPAVTLDPGARSTAKDTLAANAQHDAPPPGRVDSSASRRPALVVADRGRDGRAGMPGAGATVIPSKREDRRAGDSKTGITQTS